MKWVGVKIVSFCCISHPKLQNLKRVIVKIKNKVRAMNGVRNEVKQNERKEIMSESDYYLMSVVVLLCSKSVHKDTVFVMLEKRVWCVRIIDHRNETVEEEL
jgi:uncharacterized UPF0160 family protein